MEDPYRKNNVTCVEPAVDLPRVQGNNDRRSVSTVCRTVRLFALMRMLNALSLNIPALEDLPVELDQPGSTLTRRAGSPLSQGTCFCPSICTVCIME